MLSLLKGPFSLLSVGFLGVCEIITCFCWTVINDVLRFWQPKIESTEKFVICFCSLSVMFLLCDTESDNMSCVTDSMPC